MLKITIDGKERVFEDEEIALINSEMDIVSISPDVYNIQHQYKNYEIVINDVDTDKKIIGLTINGVATQVSIADRMDMLLSKMGIDMTASQKMKNLKAPMPGLILDIFVKEGQEVKEGDNLLVLEAMKMENVIKSTGEGIVKKIEGKKGEAIEKNQILIEFE